VASAAPIIETLKTKSSQVCIIAGDAEIHGSITSKTDIKVEGKVYGNIAGDMNVFVKGVVEGDISGKSVTIEQGSIVGNIKSLSSVLVSENSVIEGDVKCAQFDHNGSVKGNVQADTMATLKNAAVLSGDLNSQYLSIMDGAVICGVVSIDRSHEKKEAAVLAK
jgi:Integral membrane protein CcmA involved in cell shape determination